jgi:TolB protein
MRWFVRATVLLLVASGALYAQDTTSRPGVRIGLSYQAGTRPGVAVLPVGGAGGDSVRALLQRDFDYGDRLTVIGADAVPPPGPTGALNYPLLSTLGAAAVVQATLGVATMHVALHDVTAQRVVDVRDFPLAGAALGPEWRLAVHAAADEVERWVTGTAGIAATRIAFVRDGRVQVVDGDGAESRTVGEPGLTLSPAWHPSGRYLAYSLHDERGTRIEIRDLAQGSVHALEGVARGLNITPVFSPDGATIVYAHGEEEGTDLVAAAFPGGTPTRRVTVGRGTDNVSPSFSPDGRRVAFTSGRSGHPEVYITDVDGTNAELLTPFSFGDQAYRSNPDWSPDGRTVAFQSQLAGVFQVMTIALRDRTVKQLTSEGRNEDPSWAPDGRHLVFTSTRTGTRQLFVLDVESGRVRQLTRGGAARMAAWSPKLSR